METEALAVHIDKAVKRRFKVAVAERDTDMTTAVEAVLRLYNSGKLDTLLEKQQPVAA